MPSDHYFRKTAASKSAFILAAFHHSIVDPHNCWRLNHPISRLSQDRIRLTPHFALAFSSFQNFFFSSCPPRCANSTCTAPSFCPFSLPPHPTAQRYKRMAAWRTCKVYHHNCANGKRAQYTLPFQSPCVVRIPHNTPTTLPLVQRHTKQTKNTPAPFTNHTQKRIHTLLVAAPVSRETLANSQIEDKCLSQPSY